MGKKQSRLVKKSNALIRSHWSINSVWEPRLVALVASKICVDDEDFKTYKIPITELVDESGQARGGYIYSEIARVVRSLMGRVIEINDDPTRDKFYALFSACEIDKEAGIIEVRFDYKLKPHYLQLKECFTLYNFEEFMKLPSAYSQRIFEILMSWHNMPDGEVTISMDELHQQLDTPKSYRKDFKAFRLFVLEQSHKDITKNPSSSLDYEWLPIKKGRKVIAVRFVFDKQKIILERKAQEKEAQKFRSKRNNEIFIKSWKCHQERSLMSPREIRNLDHHSDHEVCAYCRESNLHFAECQETIPVEIVD